MTTIKNNKIENIIGTIGAYILFYMATIVVLFSIKLFINVRCNMAIYIVAFFISGLCVLFLVNAEIQRNVKIEGIVIGVIVILITTFINGIILTYDWDGNTYHKMAVGLLKNGWNPLKESGDAFFNKNFNLEGMQTHSIWIDHYGKATWFFSAILYSVTGNIECGKAYNILGIIMLFCIAYSYIKSKTNNISLAIILSFFLAFNPISIVQIFSYYLDGFLFSLFFSLIIISLEMIEKANCNSVSSWIKLYSVMIILTNVKFTGMLYGALICTGVFLYIIYKEHSNIKCIMSIAIKFAALALICICVVGASTYISNLRDHGIFTYPLSGKDKIDIITPSEPGGFADKTNIYKLFYGYFSHMGNIVYSSEKELPLLKIPFSVHKDELVIPTTDCRISGFGFWFGGILLLSAVIVIKYILDKKKEKVYRRIILAELIFVLFISIVLPHMWWARYNPFVWSIPIITLLIVNNKKILKYVVITLLVINNLFFFLQPYSALKQSIIDNKEMTQLKESVLMVDFCDGIFSGKLFNFQDNNIIVINKNEINSDACVYGLIYEK